MRATLAALAIIAVACGGGAAPATPETTAPGTPAPSPNATSIAPSSTAEQSAPPTPASTAPPTTAAATDDAPPPLVVDAGTESLALTAWSYCWAGPDATICADGFPQEPFPALGTNGPLTLEFPVEGWQFHVTAGMTRQGGCVPVLRYPPVRAGEPLILTSGVIDVFGSGPGGDAAWTFHVAADEDVDPPSPWAEIWFTVPSDGPRTSLTLSNVAGPDVEYQGELVVSGSAGTARVPLTPEVAADCWTGTVTFTESGSTDYSIAAGTPPYTVVFDVSVGEQRLVTETFVWPEDFEEGPVITGFD